MALSPSAWSGTSLSVNTRPLNMPGMTRDNAPSRPIEPGLIGRISGALRSFLGMPGGNTPGGVENPFFPPGRPLDPIAPGAAGRRFDYPTAYNMVTRPRAYEPVDFDTLRAIADPAYGGYDLIRLAIETRKDQVSKLEHSIMPRKKPNEPNRPKSDERCAQIETLLKRPDGEHAWQQWCSMLVEEHLVTEAPAILRQRNMAGETIGIGEIIDGTTIKPLLNYDGRRPTSGPAYQQILKGVPAVDYTIQDLLYRPRNPRIHKVYGMSCVEQVLVTVNIGLRRQAGQLGFFTEGNIPDAIQGVPATWTTAQIAEYQAYWDSMVNDAVTRRKMRFVPAGVQMQMTRADGALVDQFDEWLARIIAYCFSLPPTPFVRMMNRATAETAYETALSEGLQPLMIWLKGIIDYIIAEWFGYKDLELVWDDVKKADPAEKEQRDLALVAVGVIGRDDMRAERGLEPLGIPPIVSGIGPLGFMSVDAMKKAIANGWDLTGMPQPGLPGAGGGDLAAFGGGAGDGSGDPLAGLPPEVLEALGAAPGLPTGDEQPADASQPDGGASPVPAPASAAPADASGNVVPFKRPAPATDIHRHPAVQEALRHGEKVARHHARLMAGGRG